VKATSSFVGQRVLRLEDWRLLRGRGRFVDDVDLPGQLWMRVVRAGVPHARIRNVDGSAARAARGVHRVLTGADLTHVEPIPLRIPFPELDLEPYLQPVLARDRVRYVGEPVAVVLAVDPYAAEDAAELVDVDYEELPIVLDARQGHAEGAPALRESAPNEVARLTKSYGEIENAFAVAAHVVAAEFRIGRHTGIPLETRGLLVDYDSGRGEMTVWGATLVTHYHRRVLSRLLGLPLSRIRMRTTDSGGSFGVRGDFFPEDFLVAYLAYATGRPVKWVEDRAEHFVATNHAREQLHRIEAAFDADGRMLGLRDEIWHDKGAYIRPTGVIVAEMTLGILPGPYRTAAYEATLHVVTTNKTPIGPYRGPGRYQTTFARERLFDLAAEDLGLDPLELRRRNLLTEGELPWKPGHTMVGEPFLLDSGDFAGLLEKAVEEAGFASWREEAAAFRREGRPAGAGLAFWIDKSGLGVYETAGVDVDPSGCVRVLTGGASTGQGIETVLAQIAADVMGVEPGAIEVVYGDTDLIPDGVGSWSSRTTVIGGSAVRAAAEATVEKARRIAGELLEAAPRDLRLENGRVHVAGSPERGLSLGEIAAACDPMSSARRGEDPGLGARRIYVDERMNYPYGVNLVQVELDPGTGGVTVRRSFVACEAGRAVNPMLVEGQVAGGMAQGLGGALLELLAYDEGGQPRSASFTDYLVPTAVEVPPVGVLICENAPTVTNPLGAKGMGESGIVGMGAAVAAAVADAIGDAGAIRELPITPERVKTLLAESGRDEAFTAAE
jgi:carbon-monoxide dehydrogenase large subunit/6-hydroxypseudooxynicotine dehydrogenase subunit gamma